VSSGGVDKTKSTLPGSNQVLPGVYPWVGFCIFRTCLHYCIRSLLCGFTLLHLLCMQTALDAHWFPFSGRVFLRLTWPRVLAPRSRLLLVILGCLPANVLTCSVNAPPVAERPSLHFLARETSVKSTTPSSTLPSSVQIVIAVARTNAPEDKIRLLHLHHFSGL